MTISINTSPDTLTFPLPDDFHCHLREGDLLAAVAPITAKHFGRALVMPNLSPPITSIRMAQDYRQQILAALESKQGKGGKEGKEDKGGESFQPLVTLYLTDHTSVDEITRAVGEGAAIACKLYPAHATTNAAHGVTDVGKLKSLWQTMERLGMPLLIHGEVTDPKIDIFDREAVFIETILKPLRRQFPELRIVLEHITTAEAAAYVTSEASPYLAATITPHHLKLNRNHLFQGGLRPHHYCLPVLKRERHRLAIVKAAVSGLPYFFAGTDSAPHPRTSKESACGCAGVFNAWQAPALYAEIFEEEGALDKLPAFLSQHGAAFYRLPVNQGLYRLTRHSKADAPALPTSLPLPKRGDEIMLYRGGEMLRWYGEKLTDC